MATAPARYVQTKEKLPPGGATFTWVSGRRVEIDAKGRILSSLTEEEAKDLLSSGWEDCYDPDLTEAVQRIEEVALVLDENDVERCYTVLTAALVRDRGLRERLVMFLRHLGERFRPVVEEAPPVPPADVPPDVAPPHPSPAPAATEEQDEGLSLAGPTDEVRAPAAVEASMPVASAPDFTPAVVPPPLPRVSTIPGIDAETLARGFALRERTARELMGLCDERGLKYRANETKTKLVSRLLGLPDGWDQQGDLP